MSREHDGFIPPLLLPQDARVFASLLGRLAAAFNLASLSTAEAIFVAALLDRCTRALWQVHGADLLVHLPWPQHHEPQDDEFQDQEPF